MTLHATRMPLYTAEVSCKRGTDDLKSIASGGGALLFASAFGNGLNYTLGIFLARTLGSEDYGLYALALTIFNMISLTVVFGMDIGTIKFASHHLGNGDHAKANAIVVASISIAFGMSTLAAIGLAVLAAPISTNIYGKSELILPLLWFAAAIPFAIVGNVALSATQAFQTVRHTIFIKYGWEPIAKFALAAVFLWAGFQLPGVLTAILVTLAVSAGLLLRALYMLMPNDAKPFIWNKDEAWSLIRYCLPLSISNIFGVIAPRTDILILGYWATIQDVGFYTAAFQTAAIMSLIVGSFNTGLAPIISRAWSQGDLARMNDCYQSTSRLSFMLALPIFCTFLLFARNLLECFGPEFAVGTVPLIILATGQIFNSATGAANTMLLMSGHSHLVMKNTIVMSSILLITTTVLIPIWGIKGAAVAAAATFILTNVVRAHQVWRIHHVQPYTWALAKPIAAAALATGIVALLQKTVFTSFNPVLILLLGLLYLTGIWTLGICKEDREVLQSFLLRLRNIWQAT